MSAFDCPLCSKVFVMKAAWVYHLEHRHGLAPVSMYPTTVDPSQVNVSGPNLSTTNLPRAHKISPAIGCFKVGPKVSFKVAYDLGRGDKAQPIQVTIQKDESYNMFLRRLHSIFDDGPLERSLRQWEYVLVNRQYERGDPLPLTSSNTYYAMVSELLRPRSLWRHAVVRRSHSENSIIRALAHGTFRRTPDSPILDAAEPDISLLVNTPILDASQPDVSVGDNLMPDTPTYSGTSELLASTPPARAWVVNSASTTPSIRTPSPSPSSKENKRKLSTPSTPFASAHGRRLLQISSPLAPATRARDPMQSHLPLISSPLASVTSDGGRHSTRLSSPIKPITGTPKPNQLSLSIASVASAQSPILLDSSPLLIPAVSTNRPPKIQFISPLTPAAIAQHPAILSGSTASPAAGVQSSSEQLSLTSATGAIPKDPLVILSSMTLPAAVPSNPSIHLSPPLAPAASVRRTSIHLGPPSAQLSSPTPPNASPQAPSAIPPFAARPSPQVSEPIVDLKELSSALAPAVIAPRPPEIQSIVSGSASSPNPAPELFHRPLNLPPRSTSNSSSSVAGPRTKPTLIIRPRRPLRIISRQHLNSGVEYEVHWNSGRKSWEPHDSLYRDYPTLIDKYLEGRR